MRGPAKRIDGDGESDELLGPLPRPSAGQNARTLRRVLSHDSGGRRNGGGSARYDVEELERFMETTKAEQAAVVGNAKSRFVNRGNSKSKFSDRGIHKNNSKMTKGRGEHLAGAGARALRHGDLHVPIMSIEMDPAMEAEVAGDLLSLRGNSSARGQQLSVALNRRTTRKQDTRTAMPKSCFHNNVADVDLADLNQPSRDKFPVFFAGGSITVRAWANGDETPLAIKYLCLQAFGSLDREEESELISSNMDPQFLEWPTAAQFTLRVGAKTCVEEHVLTPGCILEIRNPKWLEGIRVGRERAALEAQLAPMTRLQLMARSIELLLNDPSSSGYARIFAYFMMAVIIISTVALCVETLPQYFVYQRGKVSTWFFLEAACIAIFTLELLVRVVVAPNKLRFFMEWMNIIDFVSILPFYLELFAQGAQIPGLSVLRVLRLARILRIFKVSQGPLQILIATISRSLTPMYSLAVLIAIAAVLFAAGAYYAERGTFNELTGVWERRVGTSCPVKCPDDAEERPPMAHSWLSEQCNGTPAPRFFMVDNEVSTSFSWMPAIPEGESCKPIMRPSPFNSIPVSAWWSLVTMTTLGYGDMVPVTSTGKIVGVVCMLCGILVIALPVTVIGQNFSEVYGHFQQMQKRAAEIANKQREMSREEAKIIYRTMDEYQARDFRLSSLPTLPSGVVELGRHVTTAWERPPDDSSM